MNTTIRKGVFETNSSSVHTLTIQKADIDFKKFKGSIKKEIEDGITFGTYNSSYDGWKDKTITDDLRIFREKLDGLWRAICCDESGFRLSMKCTDKIKEVCEKNGVKYYLNYTDEWFDNCSWSEFPKEFLETLLEDDNMEKFIFGIKSNFCEHDRDYFWQHEDEYYSDDVIVTLSGD